MRKRDGVILGVIVMLITLLTVFLFTKDQELRKEIVQDTSKVAQDIVTYSMTEEDVKELPTTEIVEQTEEQEKEVSKEQEVEQESFKLQGDIAYEGDRAKSWNVTLGDYKGLTYYSQIDGRWSNKMYSSIGDRNQTIGTSGCRFDFRSNDSNGLQGNYNSRYNVRFVCAAWI